MGVSRNLAVLLLCLVIGSVLLVKKLAHDRQHNRDVAAACHGEPFQSAVERKEAEMQGQPINQTLNCIDQVQFEALQQPVPQTPVAARRQASDAAPVRYLKQARAGFHTAVSVPGSDTAQLPEPPSSLFVRSDYHSGNLTLAAFVTPDPHDGQKHPAIIWVTGGDSSTLDDFWTPGTVDNDQSAHAFRDAGLVMMFPTLRGGNTNPGNKEYFFGEVDDLLAAADRLSSLPYVDPNRIYLGGHSTGGTLVLLTAEASGRFRAVFALGPVAEISRYPFSILPVSFWQLPEEEARLRSPANWLGGIARPTYIIEGAEQPGNIDELNTLCKDNKNPALHCVRVAGYNHFSEVDPVTRAIAARLAVLGADAPFDLNLDELQYPRKNPTQ